MVLGNDPGRMFEDVVRTGIETFKSTVEGITAILRTGDSTLRDLDSALTGAPPPQGDSTEQAFVEVMALMQGAMQEAHEHGSATAGSVVQRARDILGRVSKAEPSWRPGPSMIRNTNDMIRVALRDLRASNSLLKLAQGQGSLDDLDSLSKWADDFSGRLDVAQRIIAQPKPGVQTTVPEPAAETEAPQSAPATTKPKTTRKKRDTTPKKKGNPQDIAFARAVAEELGDTKVKGWADDYANGKISEKQWVSRLTNHAAANYDNLDEVFSRATERIARESGGQ